MNIRESSRKLDEELWSIYDQTNQGPGLGPARVKTLEPRPYSGERGAMLIENFLWDLQWYLNTNISSEEEVFLAA
ncbi:unnamed protein product [Spirodela intermedia]|uniref:Uncharacterized protein n=1 Tax=Spirodela intermedia TaxID=51605 RepID=A0A7I8IR76_SPIIN|nr:unnamed protein product [Spirodela intermedia]CAA6660480.1 unnamed protein product [Spirodela intermedia]